MQTQLPAGQSNHLYKCTEGTSSLTTPFISDYTFLSPPPCIPPNHPGRSAVFPICKHAPSTQRKAEKVAYNSNRLQGKGVSQVALHTLTLPHPPGTLAGTEKGSTTSSLSAPSAHHPGPISLSGSQRQLHKFISFTPTVYLQRALLRNWYQKMN